MKQTTDFLDGFIAAANTGADGKIEKDDDGKWQPSIRSLTGEGTVDPIAADRLASVSQRQMQRLKNR